MAIVRPIEGHAMEVVPTESGRRWRLLCSCGFGRPRWVGDTPKTCSTDREAVKLGIWHLEKIQAELSKAERDLGVSTARSHPRTKTG